MELQIHKQNSSVEMEVTFALSLYLILTKAISAIPLPSDDEGGGNLSTDQDSYSTVRICGK